MPALLTATSRAPNLSIASSTSVVEGSRRRRRRRASRPRCRAARQARQAVGGEIRQHQLRAPAARRSAVRRPNPPVAPLTSATLPSNDPIVPSAGPVSRPCDRLHGQRRQEPDRLAVGPRLFRVGGVAVERALVDALADRGQPEEGKGEVEGPVVDAVDARAARNRRRHIPPRSGCRACLRSMPPSPRKPELFGSRHCMH